MLSQINQCKRSSAQTLKQSITNAKAHVGKLFLVGAVGLACLLLFPFLGTVPGLHGDEAWAGARAHEIVEGSRPVFGMNHYTGPLQQYLLAGILYCLGCKVAYLRLLTVAFSLLSVFLYYLVIKRMFNQTVAGLAALILVTMPAFTVYSRPALEIFALNPVLALGGVLLLLEAIKPKGHFILAILSGICLGLGTWNHLIFLSVPIALLVTSAVHSLSAFKRTTLYCVLYGFCLALFPRIYVELPWESFDNNAVRGMSPDILHATWQRLQEWPGLVVEMAHGDSVFKKYAGEPQLHCPNLIWIILLAGLVAHLKNEGIKWSVSARQAGVFGISLFLATVVLCQRNVDQYFLLILYIVPVLLAFTFVELATYGISQVIVRCLLGLFICLQLARTVENYFISQINSHGKVYDFQFGSNWLTSNNSIRTDELYKRLVLLGAKKVYAEFFISMPLRFYDLETHRFEEVRIVESINQIPSDEPDKAYAVVYVGGIRRMKEQDYAGFKLVSRDEHFMILQAPSVTQVQAKTAQ